MIDWRGMDEEDCVIGRASTRPSRSQNKRFVRFELWDNELAGRAMRYGIGEGEAGSEVIFGEGLVWRAPLFKFVGIFRLWYNSCMSYTKEEWKAYYAKNKAKIAAKARLKYYANHEENKLKQRTRQRLKAGIPIDAPKGNPTYLTREEYVFASKFSQARAEGATGTCSHSDWLVLLGFYRNRCAKCRRPFVRYSGDRKAAKGGLLTIDHIIPVRLGGANTPNNLQPLCLSCNTSKDKTIDLIGLSVSQALFPGGGHGQEP